MTGLEEKPATRAVRRDIFEFPHICEAALVTPANASEKQAFLYERYRAIYHGLRKGWSCTALAARWNVRRRATVWDQWQEALALIRNEIIRQLDADAYEESDEIELMRGWRYSVGVMKKEGGRWRWVRNTTIVRAIAAIEGDAPEEDF